LLAFLCEFNNVFDRCMNCEEPLFLQGKRVAHDGCVGYAANLGKLLNGCGSAELLYGKEKLVFLGSKFNHAEAFTQFLLLHSCHANKSMLMTTPHCRR
jgi:hypothetical protein